MNKATMNALFDMAFPKEEVETKVCQHVWVEDEIYFCTKCGCKENVLVDRTYNFYDKPIAISALYKRVNHFKEQINNLCGFDNKVIPQHVLDLCRDCKDQEEIKIVLQEYKFKPYYEHVYSLMKAQGKPIPYLDKREIDRLVFLFNSFLTSYNRHKKLVNCISYHFILSILLPLIKRQDVVPFLYKLKNERKRREHLKVCKLIFNELGWNLDGL
jgi:hypothetical protein